MLAHEEVAPFLLSRGVFGPRDVVEGALRVRDVSRRNVVYLAENGEGPAYVLKQGDVAHEARVLRLLAGPLRGWVPEVLDAGDDWLLLRSRAGSDWASRGAPAPTQVRSLGRLLGTLRTVELPDGPPPTWLDLTAPPAAILADFRAASLDLVALVQADDDLCERLHALGETLVPEVAMHGDLRVENCIAAGRRVVVVDWENASRGPRGWDVATVLAEFLRVWMGSVPIPDVQRPSRLLALARHPLARLQPLMSALWACSGGGDEDRVWQLAGARLVDAAIELARGASALSSHVLVLLDLAANLIRDPRRFAPLLR